MRAFKRCTSISDLLKKLLLLFLDPRKKEVGIKGKVIQANGRKRKNEGKSENRALLRKQWV